MGGAFQEWLNTVSLLDLGVSVVWIVTVMGALLMLRKWFRPWLLMAKNMLIDWHGVADRPGVPGRPGAMVRFATQANEATATRARVEDLVVRMAVVEKTSGEAAFHSQPNHGTSAYDDHTRKLDALLTDVRKLSRTVSQHDKALSFLSADEPDEEVPR